MIKVFMGNENQIGLGSPTDLIGIEVSVVTLIT